MSLLRDPSSFEIIQSFEGPEADIGVTYADGIAVVSVLGELDLSNSARLWESLHGAIDSGVTEVVLDIAQLTYMDSTGLSVLVGAHQRMRDAGGTFTVLAPMSIVAKLFAVTEVVSCLTIRAADPSAN